MKEQANWDNTCEIDNCDKPTDTTINCIRYCSKHLFIRDEEVYANAKENE